MARPVQANEMACGLPPEISEALRMERVMPTRT